MDKLDHWQARVDLACAFRWAARLGLHEAIANHFSLAVSADGRQFLINPYGMHFSEIRASDLILVDADDPSTLDRPDAPDITAWALHGALHRTSPRPAACCTPTRNTPPHWPAWPTHGCRPSSRTACAFSSEWR